MPPPRKPSPRGRERRTRSRSYSPRPSYSSRRKSGSRSPRDAREKRRSASPSRKRSPARRRSRSPHERSRSPRQVVRRSSPRRSPQRRSRSPSYERGQPVKRAAADSSGKRVSSYRSRSPSPKRSRDEREFRDEPRRSDSRKVEGRRYSSPGRSQERREGSRERRYSPRGRSPSPRHKESSSYGGKMYSDKPSSSRAPLFLVEKRKKNEISSVTIVNKSRLEKLDKRFQTLEQISRGGFDFEENITIGIHRGPSHVTLDEDVPVNYHFNPKNFLMLFSKKETYKAIFDRDEILQFHHDDILDEEAYVEKRTITVQPTEKAKAKYSDSLDYKITVGGRSSRDEDYGGSDRRMVRDSGRRRSRDRDPEVTVRLDPKPDPRYERLFKATQRRERSRSPSPRDPHDLRHNLKKRRDDFDLEDDRGRERDRDHDLHRGRDRFRDERDVVDARRKIEERRSLGSSLDRGSDLHVTKTELKERRRSQDRMRKEKGRASLDKELPDFKNRPDSQRYRSRSPPSRTNFLDRLADLPVSHDHDVRTPARVPRGNEKFNFETWKVKPEITPKGSSYYLHDERSRDDMNFWERKQFWLATGQYPQSSPPLRARGRGRGSLRGRGMPRGRGRGLFKPGFTPRPEGPPELEWKHDKFSEINKESEQDTKIDTDKSHAKDKHKGKKSKDKDKESKDKDNKDKSEKKKKSKKDKDKGKSKSSKKSKDKDDKEKKDEKTESESKERKDNESKEKVERNGDMKEKAEQEAEQLEIDLGTNGPNFSNLLTLT